MAVSNTDERRRNSRVGFTTPIQILIEANGRQICLHGTSMNLSLKGIFIRTSETLTFGAECVIKIQLTCGTDKIELLINGTVVRVVDTGMGIGFDSMDVGSYSHLKNIVCYNRMDDAY
ncbi:PilZ domain-containing protein [Desulfobacula sp.]|uniref:PilZ domain-containing protein n=1 Tax=Desulfobacula sp. TaxID=2593537 RepID=UPI0026183A24|nr:PilZ domain-containing protein [Desulfobacula sp.]